MFGWIEINHEFYFIKWVFVTISYFVEEVSVNYVFFIDESNICYDVLRIMVVDEYYGKSEIMINVVDHRKLL